MRLTKWAVPIIVATLLSLPQVGNAPAATADPPLGATSVASADPVNNTPFVQNGRVEAVATIANRVYVGGTFTQIKNRQGAQPVLNRSFLFAYDATTGMIDPGFMPIVNATVFDLVAAPDGSGLLVGGSFSVVNGVTRVGLVKLDPVTGATVSAFKAATGGGAGVFDMDVAGSKLYITGTFTKVKGLVRTRLAAVDVTTGLVDPDLNLALTDQATVGQTTTWIKMHHLDVSADGTKLMVVGDFATVGGLPRSQVALIDLTTSPDTVADWSSSGYVSTKYRTSATGVSIDPTGTYAVVVATCCAAYGLDGNPTMLGHHAARFELAPVGVVQPTWFSASGEDSFTDVTVTSTVVYVGGHFRWVNAKNSVDTAGSVAHVGLAALDPDTGVPFNWNPGRIRGYGVLDSIITNDQFIIGHDTTTVGGEWHPRLAAFPLIGGATIPLVMTPALPVTLYSLAATPNADVVTRTFDGTLVGEPAVVANGDWSWLRGAFTNGQYLYAGSSDGSIYRLTADGTTWSNPVNLAARADLPYGLPISFASVEAMTYLAKGVLYTRVGDPHLYWSGFNLESNLVGGHEYVIAGEGDGQDWSGVLSLALVDSSLYATTAAGDLLVLPISGRVPAPLATATVVSGPTVDGIDWSAQELVAVD